MADRVIFFARMAGFFGKAAVACSFSGCSFAGRVGKHPLTMDFRIYSIIHVLSILLLTGSIFAIAANPQPHKKKKMMILTGVLSLVVFVAGFALIAKMKYDYAAGWLIGKYVVWLFVAALAGMAYRKPKGFVVSALILAVGTALYLVYFRPF